MLKSVQMGRGSAGLSGGSGWLLGPLDEAQREAGLAQKLAEAGEGFTQATHQESMQVKWAGSHGPRDSDLMST